VRRVDGDDEGVRKLVRCVVSTRTMAIGSLLDIVCPRDEYSITGPDLSRYSTMNFTELVDQETTGEAVRGCICL
jgi:hypothetical protein